MLLVCPAAQKASVRFALRSVSKAVRPPKNDDPCPPDYLASDSLVLDLESSYYTGSMIGKR
jgi:hypothetical protein